MLIKKYSDGSACIELSDADDYQCDDNNGVTIWLTKKQMDRLKGES